MANRLAFDVGLHLNCQNDGMPENELQIRRMVMKAAMVFDKYWALFLGRPTSIKTQDVSMDLLTKRFSLMSGASPDSSNTSKTSDMEIYEYLTELMELAGKIVEHRDQSKVPNAADQNNMFAINESEENAYLHVISVDRQLNNWLRRLPDHLTWKPANIKAAPFSYFLLHQQYHISMILLHRPWAKYGASSTSGTSTNSHPSPSSPSMHQRRDSATMSQQQQQSFMPGQTGLGLGDPQCIVDDSRTSLSRSICTQQAIRVARIFWQHRQRFDGRKICVTGIQHAGTAAIALIAALAYGTSDSDRRSYLGYLEILSVALTDMSHTYQPAARMDELLKVVLEQLRSDVHGQVQPYGGRYSFSGGSGPMLGGSSVDSGVAFTDNIYSVLPGRRDHPEDDMSSYPAAKKLRQTPSRRASEFARPPPPFFNLPPQNQPTPPSSTGGFSMNQQHSQSQSMMGGVYGPDGGHFSLDFLNESAIEEGPPEVRQEDYVLVTPSANDVWGLNGVMQTQSQNQDDGSGPFDMSMSDWMNGPSTVSGAKGEATDAGVIHVAVGETDTVDKGAKDGMDWITSVGADDGINAMSPVSLSGLVQSVEKAAGAGDMNADAAPRNHELDFFQF